VYANTGLILDFNENIRANGGTITLLNGSTNAQVWSLTLTAGAVSGSSGSGQNVINWTIAGDRLSITQPALTTNITYYVNYSSAAFTDLAGNSVPLLNSSNSTGFYFTPNLAADTVVPTVSTVAITSGVSEGAIGYYLNAGDIAAVTVTMSESVVLNPGGVTGTVASLNLVIGTTTVTAIYDANRTAALNDPSLLAFKAVKRILTGLRLVLRSLWPVIR
jgi:hypothetical protein